MQSFLKTNGHPISFDRLHGEADRDIWVAALSFGHDCHDPVVKIPLTPRQIPGFDQLPDLTKRLYTTGGNLAWVTANGLESLDMALHEIGLTGLVLNTDHPCLIGTKRGDILSSRVKQVFDPSGRFLTL